MKGRRSPQQKRTLPPPRCAWIRCNNATRPPRSPLNCTTATTAPLCRRQLPDGFKPAAGADAAELTEARTQLTQATKAQKAAADQLAQARADVKAAETAIRDRDRDHRTAQQAAREAACTPSPWCLQTIITGPRGRDFTSHTPWP
ncbi:hypothetical protein [Streptomyces noursei]|uniref:hypothetical protein n=1 Tax=Streptomyces noursei TaxID=1971 RepID=UPI0021A4120E|nr:hypothetical protein [Streptomyces noursei]UWS69827.1 hypothetical protein N1H47_00115 [Streptomyces noursei]UWS76952.1 hypothetical protein N1H47_40405 [Streptomyces noursei]